MRRHHSLQRRLLPNGIVVILTENPAADLVAGRIFLRCAGACWDSLPKAGLSQLLAALIMKGTQTLSAQTIAETVESLGAHLGSEAASDYWVINLKTITADFPAILALAARLLREPAFPEDELRLVKHQTLQTLQSQRSQPFNVAFQQLRQAMYPDHPYGLSLLGTETSLPQITRQDLLDYHQAYFRPDNFVISLSGNFDSEAMAALVEKTFQDWPIPAQSLICPQWSPLVSSPQTSVTAHNSQQSIVMVGYLGAGVKSADYAPLKLINTYLGAGLSSRLFVQLREKQGLAYDVSAFYPTRLQSSQLVMYLGTAPEKTALALGELRREGELLMEEPLGPGELEAAKNKLLGQYALGKQTNGEIAHLFGWYETLGLGVAFDETFPEQARALTAAEIQSAAQRYLRHPYLSLVGPAEFVNPLCSDQPSGNSEQN
ncbi:MAG: M16 family metallopeptidase [Cyanobacteriota bacterium]|jgi:zinc protease